MKEKSLDSFGRGIGSQVHLEPSGRRGLHGYFFKCFRCDKELPSSHYALISGIVRKSVSYNILDGKCKDCRKDLRSELTEHPLLTPQVAKTLRHLSKTARRSASSRGLLCGITEEDIYALWIVQRGECAITGLPMVCYETRLKDFDAPSIDRIDSDWNYTVDNIHLVCYKINMMKSDLPLKDFRKWCAAVVMREIKDAAAELES